MAVLDRYLEALRSPGAQALTFRSGAPVEMVANGGSRVVSKGTPTTEQLRAIIDEVIPPGFRFDPDGAMHDFPYDSPVGRVRLTVKVTAQGIALRAMIWSASAPAPMSAEPMQIEPTRYASGAMKAVTSSAAPERASRASAPHGSARIHTKPQALDELFHQMLDLDASDLHLKSDAVPMVRLHGEIEALDGRPALTSAELWSLVEPILPARNRAQFDETRDTDFSYQLPGRARMRCNVFKDIVGVGAVFRQIPARVQSARELGLPPAAMRMCDAPKGLVLVTGPTGSGKSTTLAAMIDYINETRTDHIITIEDPVEFVHKDKKCLINQREIGASTMSFQAALRAALREDPDVILVGEMRDLETTAIAIETAETGHLVFGTLHTNSASSTIDRLINQYPADRQAQIRAMLSESLLGVLSQTLCRKKGGGRIAAHEVLLVSPAVSNLIREEKTFQIPTVMQTSRGAGMQTMNDALFNLVKGGSIEPAEAFACAVAKKDMGLVLTRAGMRGPWSEEAAQ